MSVTEAYVLSCDNCSGQALVYDAKRFTPQEALAHSIVRRAWTVYGEKCHCDKCPPLCPHCGQDDSPSWCRHCTLVMVADGQS